jgi:hypothetical protein
MRHVLGMAKSSLDLKGAKAQKLELDFLRLAYAVQQLRQRGDPAQGYLLVLGSEIAARVSAWAAKYGTGDAVSCIVHRLPRSSRARLTKEKGRNKAGMVAGTLGRNAADRSSAAVGRGIGEAALREAIVAAERGVREAGPERSVPLGVHWDFYGLVEGESSRVA